MRALPAILTVVLMTACTSPAELPTTPSALPGERMTAAIQGNGNSGNGNADQALRVLVQVATRQDGYSFFLSDVSVTIETEFATFSGITTDRLGTGTVEVPEWAAGHPATIHLSKVGYSPVTASVELSEKRNQLFQFAMWLE